MNKFWKLGDEIFWVVGFTQVLRLSSEYMGLGFACS